MNTGKDGTTIWIGWLCTVTPRNRQADEIMVNCRWVVRHIPC
jgi:hypothetical protein